MGDAASRADPDHSRNTVINRCPLKVVSHHRMYPAHLQPYSVPGKGINLLLVLMWPIDGCNYSVCKQEPDGETHRSDTNILRSFNVHVLAVATLVETPILVGKITRGQGAS